MKNNINNSGTIGKNWTIFETGITGRDETEDYRVEGCSQRNYDLTVNHLEMKNHENED